MLTYVARNHTQSSDSRKTILGPVIMKNVTFGYSIQWFSQLFISEKARFIIMPNRGFSNHVRKKGSP